MNWGRRRFPFFSAFFFLFFIAVGAKAGGSNSLPGEIYNTGATARALGMGSAYTAVVQDATSLYYNPAGLSLMQNKQVALLHAPLFEGAAYDYLAYGQNLHRYPGGWGFEFVKLGSGLAEGRDGLNGDAGGFGYSETGFGVGMGWRGIVLPEISFGLKWKMLNRSLGGSSDSLNGLDIGAQYGPILSNRLSIGAVVQNAAGFSTGATDDRFHPLARFGASYQLIGPLMLAAEAANFRDFSVGTEYAFGIAALRFGVRNQGFSFGGGVQFHQAYALDLAVIDNATLGLSERFSMGYKFGGGKEQQDSFAQEYLGNAALELEKHHYVEASHDFDMALSIAPRLGSTWKNKAKRLRLLIETVRLMDRKDMQDVFMQRSVQSALAHQAILSFMDHDEDRCMLFAHVAYGQNVREAAYQELLGALSKLTGIEIHRDDVLPVHTFVSRKLRDVMDGIYARNFDAAVRAGRDAVTLEPDNELAWLRLGSAYFAAGDKVNAQAAYRNALKVNTSNDKLRQFMIEQGIQ